MKSEQGTSLEILMRSAWVFSVALVLFATLSAWSVSNPEFPLIPFVRRAYRYSTPSTGVMWLMTWSTLTLALGAVGAVLCWTELLVRAARRRGMSASRSQVLRVAAWLSLTGVYFPIPFLSLNGGNATHRLCQLGWARSQGLFETLPWIFFSVVRAAHENRAAGLKLNEVNEAYALLVLVVALALATATRASGARKVLWVLVVATCAGVGFLSYAGLFHGPFALYVSVRRAASSALLAALSGRLLVNKMNLPISTAAIAVLVPQVTVLVPLLPQAAVWIHWF